MKLVKKTTAREGDSPLLDAARFDRATFTTLAEGYRRALLVHCYRMLGSYHDAEDMVQETLLRGWKARASFQGRSTLQSWLYRIATNACLDFLARHERKAIVPADGARHREEIPWLEPMPDLVLDAPAPGEHQPDARLVTRENIELAFLVALQLLSPRQRAAIILCDVLDWTAKEAAELLDMSVAAVNGSLRRGRAVLARHQKPQAAEWKPGAEPGEQERAFLRSYVECAERGDAAGLAGLLRDDVRWAMPPEPGVFIGKDLLLQGFVDSGFGTPKFGDVRSIMTRANRMPAAAFYVRQPGSTVYKPLVLDVLTIENGRVSDVVMFSLEPMAKHFGLPAELPAQ